MNIQYIIYMYNIILHITKEGRTVCDFCSHGDSPEKERGQKAQLSDEYDRFLEGITLLLIYAGCDITS